MRSGIFIAVTATQVAIPQNAKGPATAPTVPDHGSNIPDTETKMNSSHISTRLDWAATDFPLQNENQTPLEDMNRAAVFLKLLDDALESGSAGRGISAEGCSNLMHLLEAARGLLEQVQALFDRPDTPVMVSEYRNARRHILAIASARASQ